MRVPIALIVLGGVLAAPSASHAGDKVQGSLILPSGFPSAALPTLAGSSTSAAWVHGTSKGKFKMDDRCRVKTQLKKLDRVALPDSDPEVAGDEVVCIVHLNAVAGGTPESRSIVLRGEVKNGAVKIKADLKAEGACNSVPDLTYDFNVVYVNDELTVDADTSCTGNGGTWVPVLAGVPGVGDQGVCRGAFVGHSTAPVVAVMGIAVRP